MTGAISTIARISTIAEFYFSSIATILAILAIICEPGNRKGGRFSSLNSALNFILKGRACRGLDTDTNQARCITPKQIDYLWEKGLLGSNNRELLRDTLVFVLGNEFASRAWQEHRNLRMDNFQLSIQTDESCAECLQYVEDVSKNNNGA